MPAPSGDANFFVTPYSRDSLISPHVRLHLDTALPPRAPLPQLVSYRVASPGWSGGAASSRLTGSLLIFSRVRILIQSHLLHSHLLLIVSLCALVRRKGLKTERSISGCLLLLLPPFPSAPPTAQRSPGLPN